MRGGGGGGGRWLFSDLEAVYSLQPPSSEVWPPSVPFSISPSSSNVS